MKPQSIPMTCQRCHHVWNYKGKKNLNSSYSVYVSCPKCRTLVKLKECVLPVSLRSVSFSGVVRCRG